MELNEHNVGLREQLAGTARDNGFSKVDESNVGELYGSIATCCITSCAVSIIGALALGVGTAFLMRHYGIAKKIVIPTAIATSVLGLAAGCIPCKMGLASINQEFGYNG